MKRSAFILAALQLLMMTGCSAAFRTAGTNDDLYGIHNKTEIAQREKAEYEYRKAEAEAREAKLQALIAEAKANAAEQNYSGTVYQNEEPSFSNIEANTYESAYARRLRGFQSPSYRMPSSYYAYATSNAMFYASSYDPAFYNVMVSGDQVWVEPKYITSMFGTWGADVVLPYGWYNGWIVPRHYVVYGYPHYSWSDWYFGCCYHRHYGGWGYNPWHWGHAYYPHGYYRPYHYYHGYYWRPRPAVPGTYRPSGHYSRPGSKYDTGALSRPSGVRNGTVRRSGTVTGSGSYKGSSSSSQSTNRNHNSGGSSYRGGNSSSSSYNNNNSGYNRGGSTRSYDSGSSSRNYGGSSGYSGGGSMHSGSSHGGGQRR